MMTVSAGTRTEPFCLKFHMEWTYTKQACHVLSLPTVVEVNFTTSLPIEVTEGDGVSVTLRGKAFGFYANPIEIGIFCAPVDVTGVPAGRDKH